LRRLSGGAHFNAPLKCLVLGAVIYSLIGIIAAKLVMYELTNQIMLSFILLVSLLLVFILAPVDSAAKPIHSRGFRIILKSSSIGFVVLSLIFISVINNPLVSVSAVLGVFYQSITLLPVFNKGR